MSRSIITTIFVLLAAPHLAAAESVDFTSADSSFSLKHPAEWQPGALDKAGMVANIVSPPENERDLFYERLNIVVVEMNQDADLNELVDEVKPSLVGRLAGYKQIADEKTTVAGKPARRLVGEMQIQGTTAKSTQWMFINGQKLYIVTFTALAETETQYAPVVQAMVDSLKFKE